MLIGSVLLQPGKTDAGALFTSNVSSTAFAPRGTASVLSKVTIAAAVMFMMSALMISMPALSGNASVLGSNNEAPAETATEAPASQPAAIPAAQTNVEPGEVKRIIIPADASNTGTVVEMPATSANTAGAAPASNGGPPANK